MKVSKKSNLESHVDSVESPAISTPPFSFFFFPFFFFFLKEIAYKYNISLIKLNIQKGGESLKVMENSFQ